MAAITYKNASCIYEGSDKLAVDSLNLDIQDGEFVVLVGPSGSGKSTALRMLAGLEDIDEGTIEIGGKNMTGVPSKDRDIAMVFQNYALYPNKTVAENMGFALKLRGVSADERRKKVEEAAKVLDLTEHLDRKPAKLSGGQRQRVAMGRAIVREPQVFCMDEPLSNLDAKLRVQTRTQIAALQRRLGTTTVYVTHDQVEAMTMGDRVAVLRFGKLQQFAAPNELYDRPANAFVAGFIGSPAMNLVTLPVTADGVKIGDSTLELERDNLTKLSDAGLSEVTFGIRPEQLELTDSGGVEVVVDLVEDLGSEAYVYTHAGSASNWWRGATRAPRPNWPTRCACAAIPTAWSTCSIRRPANASTTVRAPEFRLRTPTPGLLGLPWDRPLSEWNVPDVPLRDIAVGPSRHLVKFVEADDLLWAVKDMPARIAAKEYDVLRRLEEMGLPAVRPAGLVLQPEFDTAILVTRYLEGSWQYRRLFMRLPPDQPKHRERLLDAMAGLMVELHRHGVFWGDCSLANTLFSRDGQVLQAWLVDAETSEVHPTLSRGQRQYDLDILVENVAMGMVDLAERLGRPEALQDTLIAEAEQVQVRYDSLWELLHAEPVFGFTDRYRVEGTVRRLNDLGFAVDEVSLQPVSEDPSQLKIHVAVGDRRYHAQRLRELTGLDVGEGQARILLGDLRAYQAQLCREAGHDVDESTAARLWVIEVVTPTEHLAHAALNHSGTAIQAYCDLLEVRWLLSEQAGRDVGTNAALAALRGDVIPTDSAAKMAIAEVPTAPFAVLQGDDDA